MRRWEGRCGADRSAPPAPRRIRPLALRYDRPAVGRETESLPIGNGTPGANVFDGVRTERLTYNEKTLWTGGPGGNDNPPAILDGPPATFTAVAGHRHRG